MYYWNIGKYAIFVDLFLEFTVSLTISAAQVDALIANPSSIAGYSSSGPIIISGAITHTQASNLNSVDATYIQATVSETSLAIW